MLINFVVDLVRVQQKRVDDLKEAVNQLHLHSAKSSTNWEKHVSSDPRIAVKVLYENYQKELNILQSILSINLDYNTSTEIAKYCDYPKIEEEKDANQKADKFSLL
jgi:hypothetical protein